MKIKTGNCCCYIALQKHTTFKEELKRTIVALCPKILTTAADPKLASEKTA